VSSRVVVVVVVDSRINAFARTARKSTGAMPHHGVRRRERLPVFG
jgi:hypothetical protein